MGRNRIYLAGAIAALALGYAAASIAGHIAAAPAGDPLTSIGRGIATFDASALLRPWEMQLSPAAMVAGIAAASFALLGSIVIANERGKFDFGREYGDARWATKAEIAKIGDDARLWNNLMYTDDCWRAIEPFTPAQRKLAGATSMNTCIVGGTGTGKDYTYIIPLVMQLVGNSLPYVHRRGDAEAAPPPHPADPGRDTSADMLLVDSKGSSARECGWLLEKAGYEVTVFDIIEMIGDYNPLASIPVRVIDSADSEEIAFTVRWWVDGVEQAPMVRGLGMWPQGEADCAAVGEFSTASADGAGVTLRVGVFKDEEQVSPYEEEGDALLGPDIEWSKAAEEGRAGTDEAVKRIDGAIKSYRYTRTGTYTSVSAISHDAALHEVTVEVGIGRYMEEPAVSCRGFTEAAAGDGAAQGVVRADASLAGGATASLGIAADVRAMRTADMVQLAKNVDCLVANLDEPDKKEGDPFWSKAERLYIMMAIAYIFERFDNPAHRNIATLLRYLDMSKVDNADAVKSPFDIAIDEWETGLRYVPAGSDETAYGRKVASRAGCEPTPEGPHASNRSLAVHCYRAFHQGAAETLQSILISVSTAMLATFSLEVQQMTRENKLGIEKLGDPDAKRAVICIVDDMDHTFDYLFAMMIYQAITINCRKADRVYGGKLPRQVHFILNEFANIATIPSFERMIAVLRSRNMVFHVILQSLQQLNARYGEGAQTIRDNCSALVFLGGQSEETLKGLETMAGTETIEEITTTQQSAMLSPGSRNRSRHGRELVTVADLRMLDSDEAIVFIQGQRPFKGHKVRTNEHPLYRYIYSEHERPAKAPRALFDEPWTYQGYLERKGARAA